MFIIKATYRSETRKFSFPDHVSFPSYHQLYNQLYRVFPISHNYYLSKLLFSPDSSKPSRILIGREVHSAEEFDACIAPFCNHVWPSALLRFSIYDETPHKVPSAITCDRRRAWSQSRSDVSSHVQPEFLSPRFTYAQPSVSPSHVPPPPIIFSSPPRETAQAPMDVDIAQPGNTTPRRTWPEITSLWTSTPQQPQSNDHQQPCCSVAEGKAEVEALLSTFKQDLDRILTNTFGSAPTSPPVSVPATSSIPQAPVGLPIQPLCFYPPPLAHTTSSTPMHPPSMNFQSPSSSTPQMWCASCSKSFYGPWYRCDRCVLYIMCPECFERGQPAEMHRHIYDSNHTMLRQEPTSAPFTPSPNMPTSPSLRNPVPLQTASPTEHPTPEPVVHKGIACDMCSKIIVGVRHKCLDCADYDLCSSCLDLGGAEIHNPFHEFFDIEEPGRVIVHTVFSGNGERDASSSAVRSSRNADSHQEETVMTSTPVSHNAFCDLCDSKITGERYKCLNCPDFDTCSSCFSITPEQHPRHGFAKISRREDLIMRNALAVNSNQRHFATCNECKRTIHGVRYKCMHPDCPDFDLCAGCEALPIPVHPTLHPMLKMNRPDVVVPTVYRFGASELIPPARSYVCQRTRSPETTPASSRSSSPVRVPGAFSCHSASSRACSSIGTPRNPFTSTSTLDSLYRNPFEERAESPVQPPPDSDVTEEDNVSHADTETPAPTPEVPSSRFMLPPLALDPTSDLFREFWPRVAQELRMLMQESTTTSVNNGSPPQMTETQRTHIISSASEDDNANDVVVGTPFTVQRPSRSQAPFETGRADSSPSTAVNHSLAALLNYQSPSPAVTSPLATSQSSLNENDSIVTPPDLISLEDAPLSAAFLSDTTVVDGQIFPPGAEFVKSWRMVNDGFRAWPDTTELVFVAGERLARDESVPQKVKIGAVQREGEVDVWTGELKAPDATGRYVSYWRLSDGEGNFFGHSIWIDITVVELGRRSDGSSESSLGSSSIVMPQSAPVRSTAPSDVANGKVLQQAPSLTLVSPVTVASRLTTDDAVSDNGSDASSVSLISVPSSDDDIDQAEWEDSRSHVLVPSPAAGMEYVVLYDESSDEE